MDSAFLVHVFLGLISLANFQLIDRSEYCTDLKDERICYSLGSANTLNWAEGYQICSDTKTALPIIRNSEEKTNLETYFQYLKGKRIDVNSAWLSGRWINFENWTWVNGRKSQQNASVDGRKDSHVAEEDKPHGTVKHDLSFIRARPDFAYPYLCQNDNICTNTSVAFYMNYCDSDGQCKDGIGIQLTNSCLILYDQHYSWYVARSDCIVKGGDLAVLNNQDIDILRNHNEWQNKYLYNWVGLIKGSWVWISRLPNSRVSGDEEGQVESEELRYYNWQDGLDTFGKDRCISSTRSANKWNKLLCNDKQSVICERRVHSNGSDIPMKTGTKTWPISLKDFQVIDRSEYCTEIKDERICYSLGSENSLNWAEGYQICSDTKTALPIIRNAEEKTNLDKYFEYLKGKGVNVISAWLSGRWINFQNWTWVNGRKSQQNVSVDGRKDSHVAEEDKPHGTVKHDLSFIRARPDFAYPYLCQNDGQCKDGIGIQLTKSCLILYDQHYSWYAARNDCFVKGGDLAVLNNQDIDILKNHNEWQNKYLYNWVGLIKGSWFWIQTLPNSRVLEDEEGQMEREELRYYNWPNSMDTFGKDRCISSTRSSDKWNMLLCNAKQSVICERRATIDIFMTTGTNAYTVDSGKSSQDEKNVQSGTSSFVLGLALVGVLLFIAIGVIVGLVIRSKTNARNMEISSDGHYQDPKRTLDTNIDRELSGYYEEIELGNSGYQSLRTSQINMYIDIIDVDADIESHLEDRII